MRGSHGQLIWLDVGMMRHYQVQLGWQLKGNATYLFRKNFFFDFRFLSYMHFVFKMCQTVEGMNIVIFTNFSFLFDGVWVGSLGPLVISQFLFHENFLCTIGDIKSNQSISRFFSFLFLQDFGHLVQLCSGGGGSDEAVQD